MPTYHFRGRRYDTGAVIAGERAAPDKQSVAASLRGERVMPISITEKGREFSLPALGARVSGKELALFTRQFSVMLDAGLPLVQCLGIMADQQENKVFQNVLHQVRQDVEAGATLADALRKHPKVFDDLFVNMIAAGEAGGILDVILHRLSSFLEKIVKLKRAVVSALAYPSFIVLAAIVVVTVIMLYVIPTFVTLFAGMKAPLPLLTRITILASHYLSQFIVPLMILVMLGVASIRYYYKTEQGRLVLDRLLLMIPVLGVVLKKIAIARFSRTLATLLTSGISILEALEITARTAGNVLIQNALLQARREVEEGKTLVEPLKRIPLFPPMVTQMVGVGEQTGELDQMLQKLADYYEEEADAAISSLLTLLEPLMLAFIGVVIGAIVISVYWPIFSVISHLTSY